MSAKVSPEHKQARMRAASARYRQRHPDRIRKYNLKYLYGVTPDQYQTLIASQKGLCAICNEPQTLDRPLYLDHCHTTLEPRGLLCHRCNTGLGNFRDNPALLDKAKEYINRDPRRA
jgi:hypothetical protein